MKDYTFARAAWRNSRPGKGGGKGSQPDPNPKSSRRGSSKGGLTAEALQRHTEDVPAVDWSKVASNCKHVGAPQQS